MRHSACERHGVADWHWQRGIGRAELCACMPGTGMGRTGCQRARKEWDKSGCQKKQRQKGKIVAKCGGAEKNSLVEVGKDRNRENSKCGLKGRLITGLEKFNKNFTQIQF